jgi:tetratricopeptide (TPR) repeat protein
VASDGGYKTVRETTRWADFALTAESQRREGALAEAEQLLRSGLDAQPDSAEGALVLALLLLDGDRGEEAREVLERCAEASRDRVATDGSDTGEVFTDRVSDSELDSAFESAETNLEEMFDADAIAQRAMRETESDLSDELASPTSSFATRTVAELLEKQGDDRGASRIRAIVDSPAGTEPGAANSRDRHDQTIEQLERWLVNLRGASK